MSQDIVSPLQKTSYCNKDFEAVYVELLDLIKQLTSKWDPSISNESDPGVVLVKLNALIADKCNFNIDTNILETFPVSVTQDTNARILFEQLGYFMHWYKSATTEIALKWIGDEDSALSYTIPAFTTVSNGDNSMVYTLIGSSEGVADNEFKVGNLSLTGDGTAISFKAIQGTPVKYSINGATLITYDYLDSNNRLYFPSTDVAQNGIFICNANENNYSSWVRKDNLLIESLASENTFYKFGVSQDNSTCYLEFPENAEELFRNGIYITYIRTLGADGNISARAIEQFYGAVIPEEDSSVTLTSELVNITNINAGLGGEDPETINDAYYNYKHVVGTFDTLITLRDYLNYILSSELVSNGFVCDRTNDIQTVYKIMSKIDGISQQISVIETEEVEHKGNITVNGTSYKDATYLTDEDLLTAFSLKLYLLKYVKSTEDTTNFNKTFSMLTNTELLPVQSYIDDSKSITHDYCDILPITTENAHICFFKNKYPLSFKVIPQYTLSTAEKGAVKNNIISALHSKLNARELEFGEELSLDYLIDSIKASDSRIKNISIDGISYDTYAVYYDGNSYKEALISSASDRITIDDKSTSRYSITVDEKAFTNKIGICNYKKYIFKRLSNTWYIVPSINTTATSAGTAISLDDYGITISQPSSVANYDYFSVKLSLNCQLRDEIYAKSVLAGATQLLVKDESYDYRLNQTAKDTIDNIKSAQANVDITFTNTDSSYKLRDNESIRLFAPNLIDTTQYGNYTRIEYVLLNTVTPNTNYELHENECIMFYWKDSTDENAIYQYAGYGAGTIICLNGFTLPSGDCLTCCRSLANELLTGTLSYKSTTTHGNMTFVQSLNVAEITSTTQILTSSKTVTIKKKNTVQLKSSENLCYWSLNDSVNDTYRLFDEGATTRVLDVGEYFFYTNSSKTDFVVLGAGTKLTRTNDTSIWSVAVTDLAEVLAFGVDALEGFWFKLPTSNLTITENQYITIGPGNTVNMTVTNYTQLNKPVTTLDKVDITNKYTFDANKFYSNFQASTSGDITFTYKDSNWYYNNIVINGSKNTEIPAYGITGLDSTKVANNSVLTLTLDPSWSLTLSNNETSLANFEISYIQPGATTVTSIPSIALADASWTAQTILSISSSNTDGQVLLSNQSITVTVVDDAGTESTLPAIYGEDLQSIYEYICDGSESVSNTYFAELGGDYYQLGIPSTKTSFVPGDVISFEGTSYKINGTAVTTTKLSTAPTAGINITSELRQELIYPVVLLFSSTLDFSSSSAVTTYTDDENNNRTYLSLYKFRELTSILDKSIVFNIDDTVDMLIPYESGKTSTSRRLQFSLPVGEYVLPLTIGSDSTLVVSLDKTSVSDTTHRLVPMWYKDVSSSDRAERAKLTEQYTYYLYLNITGGIGTVHTIDFTLSGHSKDTILRLGNIYKYVMPTNLTDISGKSSMEEFYFNKILNMIAYFDKKHQFDYTYEVTNNISNPLDAKSFFDTGHIYNKYVLAQLDTTNETGTSAVASMITFVK